MTIFFLIDSGQVNVSIAHNYELEKSKLLGFSVNIDANIYIDAIYHL